MIELNRILKTYRRGINGDSDVEIYSKLIECFIKHLIAIHKVTK